MAEVQVRTVITPAEYYARERGSLDKHDFYQGEIFCMAGGSTRHSMIKTDLSIELGIQLKGKPCGPFDSDQRLRVQATGLRTYPDVSIYCGPLEYDEEDQEQDTAINPTVLFEVLSDSTEAYDRGLKAENYRRIESLQAYVFLSQKEPHVELYERIEDGNWRLSEVRGLGASIPIPCVGVVLHLAEIYGRAEALGKS